MKANDTALKRYYKAIKSWLPCSRKLKNQIIGRIQSCVEEYLEQRPDADMLQLQDHFGDPQTIAATYVENTGTAEILKDLRIRKRIVRIVASVMASLVILWAGVVAWATIDAKESIDGQVTKSVYESVPE